MLVRALEVVKAHWSQLQQVVLGMKRVVPRLQEPASARVAELPEAARTKTSSPVVSLPSKSTCCQVAVVGLLALRQVRPVARRSGHCQCRRSHGLPSDIGDGIQGVPFYILDGQYAISGAQEPEAFHPLFDMLVAQRHGEENEGLNFG